MAPEFIRLAHVVSAALMFGVGIGAFWFMLTTVRSGNPAAIAITTRNAVSAVLPASHFRSRSDRV